MDEVHRLRELANRYHRLGRCIFDARALKALTDLALEAEAEAIQRGDQLKGARGLNSIDPLPP
jgi:hypothetical protein